ncbi:hypothetical protein EIN_305390 [Entamoeba invadens IP1]|uniref:Uncharacterized protein n=1 Tax=Entamoeba invadens IP1 TaxID=370355 RepID=A0A0A1U209_ENTIV|nr:hypothetical protein EIN_305390 [Entamoeba invadens IP1]ELP86693.1 hypothetical protein EIN_305390 [Entamoeba invadens IP1]|eukprot:XP_004186039.1 hypothetical protein EIN_305390 [Entamoeba invadens IP1]
MKNVPIEAEEIVQKAMLRVRSRINIDEMTEMVSDVILQLKLHSKNAMKFWKKNFSVKGKEVETSVPSPVFVDVLKKTYNIQNVNFATIIENIGENGEVSLDRLIYLMKIFGEFFYKKDYLMSFYKIMQADWKNCPLENCVCRWRKGGC